MSRRSASLAALVLASSLCAHGAEVTLAPVRDASIYGLPPGYDNTADGVGPYLWVAVTDAGVARRALLRFDLTAIPAGAQIQQVQLSLYLSRAQPIDPQVTAHRVTAPWTEGPANGGSQGHGAPASAGDVTWARRTHPNVAWAQPGGDFDPQASALATLAFPGERVVWGSTPRMQADVQGWLADPSSNHGWILVGVESNTRNAKRFESRESSVSVRPSLRVAYEPAAVMADDIPVPAWALGVLGMALAAAIARQGSRRTTVRTDASGDCTTRR